MNLARKGLVAGLQHAIIVTIIASVAWVALVPARAETTRWPDDFLTRVEALALVETLNAEILASPSATTALETWCNQHRLTGADDAKIVVRLIPGEPRPATTEQRRRLAVGQDEELKYRRVQLFCGDHFLSEAENWYVPGRLTAEMNQILEKTDTPFGKAVQGLGFQRQTFAVVVLWWPLAEGWETRPMPAADRNNEMMIPDALFEHRAVLYTKDRKPFAEVHEIYQRSLLAFPLPHP